MKRFSKSQSSSGLHGPHTEAEGAGRLSVPGASHPAPLTEAQIMLERIEEASRPGTPVVFRRRILAEADAFIRLQSALLGPLTLALTSVDAANASCPVRSSQKSPEYCPRCGATDRQSCGPNVRALDGLEIAVRALITDTSSATVTNPGTDQ